MKHSHHRVRDPDIMTLFKKNKALVTGLVSVGLVIFFVSTVLLSGQVSNLSKSDQSLAAGGTLGNATARCLDAGTIEMKFDPHSGADHYAIEGFKEYSGAGPRVFGFIGTKSTTYVAKDPDFIGNRITMDIYAQDASGKNLYGPVFAPQVTCPSSPTSHLSVTKVTCDSPGKMTLAWDPQTGADHYAIEVFSKGIGGNGGGSRVAGFVGTTDTNIVVDDPDLAGGTFTADVYAQDALNQNIYGPVFANTVTCPAAAAASWKVNMQAVCPNGNIPSKMLGTTNARWRPYPYQPNGQLVGYTNGGAMSPTGLVQIDAPIINQNLYWFSYLSYRYPNGTAVGTLKSYGSMPNSHFQVRDDSTDPLPHQVTWDETTPQGTYTLKFALPADAPECQSTGPTTTLSNVTAKCTAPDTIEMTWTGETGADHYAIEGFKEYSGAGPRVFGFVGTKETTLVAKDPDFVGNRITMDVYAQDASSRNIRGPVFAPQVTCPTGPVTPPVACTNKDIMMVLDTSGSMSGQRIRDAQSAIQALVAKLPTGAGARAGVVGFGTHAYGVADMTETMSKVSASVGKLKATGGTNLAEGISLGSGKLALDDRTHIMLILTDGLANLPRPSGAGPNDPASYAMAQTAATAAVQDNLTKGLKTVFYSVGLGKKDNLNSKWLDTLTAGTGGRSAYTSNSGDLDNLFTSLTSDICKETPSNAGANLFNKLQNLTAPGQ